MQANSEESSSLQGSSTLSYTESSKRLHKDQHKTWPKFWCEKIPVNLPTWYMHFWGVITFMWDSIAHPWPDESVRLYIAHPCPDESVRLYIAHSWPDESVRLYIAHPGLMSLWDYTLPTPGLMSLWDYTLPTPVLMSLWDYTLPTPGLISLSDYKLTTPARLYIAYLWHDGCVRLYSMGIMSWQSY